MLLAVGAFVCKRHEVVLVRFVSYLLYAVNGGNGRALALVGLQECLYILYGGFLGVVRVGLELLPRCVELIEVLYCFLLVFFEVLVTLFYVADLREILAYLEALVRERNGGCLDYRRNIVIDGFYGVVFLLCLGELFVVADLFLFVAVQLRKRFLCRLYRVGAVEVDIAYLVYGVLGGFYRLVFAAARKCKNAQ